jgi:hypothetical protein
MKLPLPLFISSNLFKKSTRSVFERVTLTEQLNLSIWIKNRFFQNLFQTFKTFGSYGYFLENFPFLFGKHFHTEFQNIIFIILIIVLFQANAKVVSVSLVALDF